MIIQMADKLKSLTANAHVGRALTHLYWLSISRCHCVGNKRNLPSVSFAPQQSECRS